MSEYIDTRDHRSDRYATAAEMKRQEQAHLRAVAAASSVAAVLHCTASSQHTGWVDFWVGRCLLANWTYDDKDQPQPRISVAPDGGIIYCRAGWLSGTRRQFVEVVQKLRSSGVDLPAVDAWEAGEQEEADKAWGGAPEMAE